MSVRLPLAAAVASLALVAVAPPVLAQDADDAGLVDGAPPWSAEATTLSGLSGLAPLGPGVALGVHDGDDPSDDERPRASVLWLSGSPAGVRWAPVTLALPDGSPEPHDLESASAVPGSPYVILAESGDGGTELPRLFLTEVDVDAEGGPLGRVVGVADWPRPVENVEGMAVARIGDGYVLVYAERAQGEPTTDIQLASMTLDPFGFGEPTSVAFTSPAVLSENDRPVSALEVSADGLIHVASAFDSGDGDGPFSASIWLIGAVVERDDGPLIELIPDPSIVAFSDGFKTESLAWLEGADGLSVLHLGTDDENLGGTLRPLPT